MNKTVFITGTNSGFGKTMVELFAANGWNVAATVRNREQHKGLFEKLPTVRQFADEMNLSPNYFGDMVKSYTGTSPQAYIQQHIICLDQSLLVSTDLSINEIAYSLGFEYPQYFSRLFKKQTGMSPQEFRKQRELSELAQA